MNRGCSWETAKQHMADFTAERAASGEAASQHAGYYVDAAIKNYGKTGDSPHGAVPCSTVAGSLQTTECCL